jgi:hypothetical protein
MKHFLQVFLVCLLIVSISACRKETFIESKDALLTTSVDTLHFDTVFTTTGSVTGSFKIFNQNDQKLRLSAVQLMGGSASPFKMNVDGTPGTNFSNVEIAPNDSMYVFVSVTINPSAANLPFIVQDSIRIDYNGNSQFVQLDAFGQNANFYRNRRVTRDTTWNAGLPFVILGGLDVDSGRTLTINKGCKIYSHADAPFIVNGTLKVNGEKEDSLRVTFQGDRLDQYYRDFPGSWPGIFFSSTSISNVLNYTIVRNAYRGITTELPARNSQTKVTLNQCVVDNIYDVGILCLASTLNATNCLVSNCGNNITLFAGGTYSFNHCTVASIYNLYLPHKNPVLFVTDAVSQTQSNQLNATFNNSIFYGEGGSVDNEIVVEKRLPASTITLNNVLYKQKTDPAGIVFQNSLRNQLPLFDSINVNNRTFNFRLRGSSPAVNKGTLGMTVDLDGLTRPNTSANPPDLGCYEYR